MPLPLAAQSQSSTGASPAPASVTTPAPLSPAAAALKQSIDAAFGADSPVAAAYMARGYAPIWLTDDGTVSPTARQLIDVLSRAGDHALPVAKYAPDALSAQMATPGPALEVALTQAYIAYATDVGSGLLEPKRVDRELHVFPERPDAGALVRAAGAASDMTVHLESLPPADPAYRRLVERFAAFRMLGGQGIWGEPVSGGRTMRPGDRNARVAEARARLTAMGDLDPNIYDRQANGAADGTQIAANDTATDVPVAAFDQTLFDQPMVEALQRFQARHGLNLDGVIGPATLRQLNVSRSTRAEQIAVNLERLRWMNRDLGERHIMVNLAGFTMAVMNNGEAEFTSRGVVGQARRHRTPEFSDVMDHMVINPSWHVPRSIATEEILPKLQADPTYMDAKGMRLVGADASVVDWSTVTPETFPGRITQRPGSGNALGTVKFMFPNQFAIYLHDTPSKRLFQRDVRAYSHGCVRVEKPHELAAHLLSGQETDPEGFFQQVLNTRRERRVNLDEPLPVHLTYRSAWIDDQGVEQFRGDIYGRDKKIAAALIRAGVSIVE
ncbi:MAG: L,D-transpeptidase family protein [Pseudomonadota bacterium]